MLDVQRLVMLRAIALEGSIAGAARSLGYTRSAVSQQLTALERTAGTALLVRTGNRVALTTVGRTLVEHTERILVELRAAEAALSREGEVHGELRVGVPFREGPPIMSSALGETRRRYPGLEIRLSSIRDETGAEEVRRGRLDMVIISRFGAVLAPLGAGLRDWDLGNDALSLCVPTGHRLAGRPSCALVDLREEQWIVSPSSALGELVMRSCAAAGFQPSVVATVDDVATALGLVGIGWGITIAPDLTPANPESAIKRVRLRGVDARRHSTLVIRDGEEHSPHMSVTVGAVVAASEALARSRAAGVPVRPSH